MKGFTIKCNNCGNKVTLDKKIVGRGTRYDKPVKIDVSASGQIDVDAVWISCNGCEQEVQVGYTFWD